MKDHTINVILYISSHNPESEALIEKLNDIRVEFPHSLNIINIDESPDLLDRYAGRVPFLKTGPYNLSGDITEQKLRMTLGASIDRARQLSELGDEGHIQRKERGSNITKTDRVSYWLSNYYMWIISFFLMVYVGLPFLAPVLLKSNMNLPAKIIYTIYKPLCHQLGFRPRFLYGEQPFYPRELAGVNGVLTYEEVTGQSEIEIREAQRFTGNDRMGFKVALCQRDTAIYGSMFLFSIVFMLTGRRIKPLPWYLWVFIGLVPIAFDGLSQLPGLASSLPDWIPMRESTPLLRTATGTLFGLFTAWYLFPLIEESMRETKYIIAEKMAVVSMQKNEQ